MGIVHSIDMQPCQGSTEALQRAALDAELSVNPGHLKRSISFWLGPGASARVEAIAEVDEDEEGFAAQGESGCMAEADYVTAAPMGKYPSTPHLPFSPSVNPDDIVANSSQCAGILAEEIVITEKLDGGNCCIMDGQVYARTHSEPTSHGWFSPIKEMVSYLQYMIPEGLALFGEVMVAIHSIEYDQLEHYFYLFGVFDRTTQCWHSWDDVVALAADLNLPTVPERFRGTVSELRAGQSEGNLQKYLEAQANTPSVLASEQTPEGFVVRVAAQFPMAAFERSVCKYVRAGHVQTAADFRRTWKKHTLFDSANKPKKQAAEYNYKNLRITMKKGRNGPTRPCTHVVCMDTGQGVCFLDMNLVGGNFVIQRGSFDGGHGCCHKLHGVTIAASALGEFFPLSGTQEYVGANAKSILVALCRGISKECNSSLTLSCREALVEYRLYPQNE